MPKSRYVRITRPSTDNPYSEQILAQLWMVRQDDSRPDLLSLIQFDDLGKRPAGKYTIYAYPHECSEVVEFPYFGLPDGEYTMTMRGGIFELLLPGPFEQ